MLSWHSGLHCRHDDTYAVQALNDDAYAVQALNDDAYAVQALRDDAYAVRALHDDAYAVRALHDDAYTVQALNNDAYAVQALNNDAYAVQALHDDADAVQAYLLQFKALGNLHAAERFANGLILGSNGSEAGAQLLDLLRLQTQPLHQLLTDLACGFLHQRQHRKVLLRF